MWRESLTRRRASQARSHARRALSEGESREEVRHVGLLALTTIGFPHTIAGLSWIEEVIETAK
jgi:alkylhydroperoxidase/carboxymuconolactone decarboxylase family protein YurZ